MRLSLSSLIGTAFLGFAGLAVHAQPNQASSVVPDTTATGWSLSPTLVSGGQAFKLRVLNGRYHCGHEYSHLQVTVETGMIVLGMTATANPTINCAAVETPTGPTFSIPALRAGAYKVYITDAPECVWTQPACKIAVRQEYAGTLTATGTDPMPVSNFTVSPTTTTAKTAFKLKLLQSGDGCGISFSHLTYAVKDNVLTLSYLQTVSPEIACILIYNPDAKYGPTFDIQGLAVGTYKVMAAPLAPCMVADPVCEMAVVPQYAGALTVVDSNGLKEVRWYAEPGEVPESKAFTLNLLSPNYGNCQTEFTDAVAKVDGRAINLSFLTVAHPERVCITNITPFGPQFKMEGLKAGNYAVNVVQNPCPPTTVCLAAPILTTVDSLFVTAAGATLSVTPGRIRANQGFDLHLLSEKLNCNVRFSRTQVAVIGQTVSLGFELDTNLHPVMCLSDFKFDWSFSVPPLKEGDYKVVLDPLGACPSGQLLCDENYRKTALDTLVVGTALGLKDPSKAVQVGRKARLAPHAWELVLPASQGRRNLTGRALPVSGLESLPTSAAEIHR